MPSFIDIRVVGDKKLQAKLNKIESKVQRKIVNKAMRAAWKPVLQSVLSYVPILTGALHDEIKLRALKRRRGTFGVHVATPERGLLGIPPESSGYYPAVLEYGSATQQPFPYLRPAFDENTDRAIRIFAEQVRAGILAAAR